jgi:ArsR family transcriptional regulator
MTGWTDDADIVFRGLTDATRRAILGLLSGGAELSVTEIAEQFPDVGRTAISAHLRVLRESNLVAESKVGRRRLYRLGPNRAASALDFLRQVYSTTVEDSGVKEVSELRKKGPGRPSRVSRTA